MQMLAVVVQHHKLKVFVLHLNGHLFGFTRGLVKVAGTIRVFTYEPIRRIAKAIVLDSRS